VASGWGGGGGSRVRENAPFGGLKEPHSPPIKLVTSNFLAGPSRSISTNTTRVAGPGQWPHMLSRYMWGETFSRTSTSPKENVHIPDPDTPRERVIGLVAAGPSQRLFRSVLGHHFQRLGIGKTVHVENSRAWDRGTP